MANQLLDAWGVKKCRWLDVSGRWNKIFFCGCFSGSVGLCTFCLTVVTGKSGGGDARGPLWSRWQRCCRQFCWVVRATNRGNNREKEVAVVWMEGEEMEMWSSSMEGSEVGTGSQEIWWRNRGLAFRNCVSANTFRKVKAAAGRKLRTFLISAEFINKLDCFYEREVTEVCMTFRWNHWVGCN